jgi:hypothetical protein
VLRRLFVKNRKTSTLELLGADGVERYMPAVVDKNQSAKFIDTNPSAAFYRAVALFTHAHHACTVVSLCGFFLLGVGHRAASRK